jgi:hypothetical protein
MCITIDNFFVYLRIMIASPFRRIKKQYKQKNNTQIIADRKTRFWYNIKKIIIMYTNGLRSLLTSTKLYVCIEMKKMIMKHLKKEKKIKIIEKMNTYKKIVVRKIFV